MRHNRKLPLILLTVASVVTGALLMTLDGAVLYAQRPAAYKQGAGPDCRCVLGVVFPSLIAAGNECGTGGWAWHNHQNPAAWAPFYDEDVLWIKVSCENHSFSGNTHPIPEAEGLWTAATAPNTDSWLTGEAWEYWMVPPGPYGYPEEDPPVFSLEDETCPCQVAIRTVLPNGECIAEWGAWCYSDWMPVLSYLNFVPDGLVLPQSVTIVVRLVCGDCILESSQSVTLVARP